MKGHKGKQIISGLLFLGIGIGYLGRALNVWEFTIFFPGWWSLFLILVALYHMLGYGIHFADLFLACIGVYFLLEANDIVTIHLTFPFLIGVCCIWIGLKVIFARRVTWYEYKASGFEN